MDGMPATKKEKREVRCDVEDLNNSPRHFKIINEAVQSQVAECPPFNDGSRSEHAVLALCQAADYPLNCGKLGQRFEDLIEVRGSRHYFVRPVMDWQIMEESTCSPEFSGPFKEEQIMPRLDELRFGPLGNPICHESSPGQFTHKTGAYHKTHYLINLTLETNCRLLVEIKLLSNDSLIMLEEWGPNVTHNHYHEYPLRDEYGYSKTINVRAEQCSTASVPKRRLLDIEWTVNMSTEKHIGDVLFFVDNRNCLLQFDFYTEDKGTVSKHMGHICELCEYPNYEKNFECFPTLKINHCHVCIADMLKQIPLCSLPTPEQMRYSLHITAIQGAALEMQSSQGMVNGTENKYASDLLKVVSATIVIVEYLCYRKVEEQRRVVRWNQLGRLMEQASGRRPWEPYVTVTLQYDEAVDEDWEEENQITRPT
uniref:Uncharacterized protein n=1 Tax=Romanomermis culicivorax TaxID=13658 RepID=A0A915L9R8_ROMCU